MSDNSTLNSFYGHIRELRTRLIISSVFFAVGMILGYIFHAQIISVLNKPVHQPLYYQTPAGSFTYIMKVSFLFGLFVAMPVLVYNLLRFIEPALGKRIKRRQLSNVAIISTFLALSGCAFALWVVVPLSLHFFNGFKINGVDALISVDSYLNFVLNALISFMILFQVPLILLFINFVKPLPPKTLLKFEKYVIIASLVIALVLPFTYDPVTQFIVAIPLIVLYNISILFIWIVNRGKKYPSTEPADRNPVPKTTVAQKTPASKYAPPVRPTRPKPRPHLVNDFVVPKRHHQQTHPKTSELRSNYHHPSARDT